VKCWVIFQGYQHHCRHVLQWSWELPFKRLFQKPWRRLAEEWATLRSPGPLVANSPHKSRLHRGGWPGVFPFTQAAPRKCKGQGMWQPRQANRVEWQWGHGVADCVAVHAGRTEREGEIQNAFFLSGNSKVQCSIETYLMATFCNNQAETESKTEGLPTFQADVCT